MEEKDWTYRNLKSKKTNIEKYGVDCAMNDKNKYRACPFDCNNNKKYNLGNFSKHMIQYHNWDKPQIKEYKIEN
jgi:hypothetical protein